MIASIFKTAKMEKQIPKEAKYRGFRAKIKYSKEDKLFFGVVVGTKDTIAFHGTTLRDCMKSFIKVVDEYIEIKRNITSD